MSRFAVSDVSRAATCLFRLPFERLFAYCNGLDKGAALM